MIILAIVLQCRQTGNRLQLGSVRWIRPCVCGKWFAVSLCVAFNCLRVSILHQCQHVSICLGKGIVGLPQVSTLGPPSKVMVVSPRSRAGIWVWAITGSYTFDGGQAVLDSDEFAASVLAAHTAAMKDGENDTPMDIEIGEKTFTPGTHRS
jgi:hypothetical protein